MHCALCIILVSSRSRFRHHPHAAEHKDDGQGLTPFKYADASKDTHGDGDDGLHIIVDANDRWA